MDAQRKVITVLGGFAVSDVPASAWARPSAQRLVKLLAVTPGHHLHREIILESLWPDLNPDAAGNALRKALYMARRALEPDGARGSQTYIRSQGASISLSSALTVDLDLFLAASDVALMGQDPAAPALALTYYTGELLPSDLYEPWTEDIRRDLLHRYQRILERAAESASRSGNHAQAVEFLTRLVALDPLNEAAQRLYIRALAATGARRDALRQFQVFRDTLFQTLGVAPEEESLQLYAALSRESSTQFPVLPPILRTHVATPLVGREVPLAQLRDALLESQLGSGRMVFVGGETGVGTTRLVAQIAQEAAASGALVLAGAAHAGSLPYEAIINALAAHIGTLSPSQWEELKTLYPAVAYLLPVGRTDLSRLSPDPELDQSRFFAALAGTLEALGSGPLVLVLDDLHAADPATVNFVHYLGAHLHRHPWLILGTYNSVDLSPATRQTLSRLVRTGIGTQIALLRLTRSETAALLAATLRGAPVDPALEEWVWARSLGNPLFAREWIHTLRERGLIVQEERWELVCHGEDAIPAEITGLMADRLHRLPERARQVVRIAAVAEECTTLHLIERVAGMGQPQVIDAIEVVLSAGLLREEGDIYLFTHPAARAAYYHLLSRARRQYLHRQVADVLSEVAPAGTVARHYRLGGEKERTLEYVQRAADEASALHSPEVAEPLYREAITLAQDLGKVGVAGQIGIRLATMLRVSGRPEEAIAVSRQAIETLHAVHDRPGTSLAQTALARAYREAGALDAGREVLEEALLAVPEGDSQANASVYSALAELLHAARDMQGSLAASEAALSLPPASLPPALRAELYVTKADVLMELQRPREAEQTLTQALLEATDSGDLAVLQRSHNDLGVLCVRLGRLEQAEASFTAAVDAARALGDSGRLMFDLANLGTILGVCGRQKEAAQVFEEAERLAEVRPGSWYSPYPALQAAHFLLATGDHHGARRLATHALLRAERCAVSQVTVLARALLARIELTLTGAEPAWNLLESIGPPDRLDAATQAEVLPVRGLLLMARGETEEARREFAGAVEVALALPYLLQAARTRSLWAGAEIAAGHLSEGLQVLDLADEIARTMGAAGLQRSNDILRAQATDLTVGH